MKPKQLNLFSDEIKKGLLEIKLEIISSLSLLSDEFHVIEFNPFELCENYPLITPREIFKLLMYLEFKKEIGLVYFNTKSLSYACICNFDNKENFIL